MANKRKKITQYRKMFLKAERLWKEIAKLRYGNECMVKKHYPRIDISHSEVIQIDHVITRADHNLFFNVNNGVPVCSTCNRAKHYKQKGVDYAIQKICMDKIGGEEFGMMMELHQTGGPNYNWKKVWWIEKVVEDLIEYKNTIDTSGLETK